MFVLCKKARHVRCLHEHLGRWYRSHGTQKLMFAVNQAVRLTRHLRITPPQSWYLVSWLTFWPTAFQSRQVEARECFPRLSHSVIHMFSLFQSFEINIRSINFNRFACTHPPSLWTLVVRIPKCLSRCDCFRKGLCSLDMFGCNICSIPQGTLLPSCSSYRCMEGWTTA